MKKAYVAGGMSGIKFFNFPAFDSAAMDLRSRGDYDIVTPSELDAPEERAAALESLDGNPEGQHSTWGECLARDLKIIADEGIEEIICLPGWEKSRGARLETFVGRLLGLPIKEYPSLDLVPNEMLQLAHGVDSYVR